METHRTLATLRTNANNIQRGFAGFSDVVLSFRIVAALGRIETARPGNSQADLTHLADEARSCTEKVETRVEHALQAAGGLEQCLGQIIQRVSELDVQQLEALPSMIGAAQQSLQAFRLRQQQAATTSLRLAHEFESFSEAISRLVTAIQFHDITRQRVKGNCFHSVTGAIDFASPAWPHLIE